MKVHSLCPQAFGSGPWIGSSGSIHLNIFLKLDKAFHFFPKSIRSIETLVFLLPFLFFLFSLLVWIYSDVDEYGFKRACNFDYASYDGIMTNYYKILTSRRIKWQSLMKNPPNFHNKKSSKLKRYVRKGIPGKLINYLLTKYFLFHICKLLTRDTEQWTPHIIHIIFV